MSFLDAAHKQICHETFSEERGSMITLRLGGREPDYVVCYNCLRGFRSCPVRETNR